MIESAKVTIVMATYNGEAHLREQLDSLIAQTYPNWRLLVHDDGSTDATLTIIHEYRGKDRRISLLDDGVSGLGAARNFLHLLNHVDTEFCMCCDQDDVWLSDKVAKMVAAISFVDGAAAVYANAYLYVDEQVVRQLSTRIHPSELRDTLFLNSGMQGCSMIINQKLLEKLKPFPDTVAMHDHLLTLGAVVFGKLLYIDEVLTLYRQHGGNATGNQEIGFFRRISSFFMKSKPVVDRVHYDANNAFYNRYGNLLNEPARILFMDYFRFASEANLIQRLLILLKNRFTLGDKRGILFVKTLLRKPV